ncbi:MAG: tryptophan synthase subunit alpha [Bifidobacteriaceae bacterium]|jgi:tryptophan synthase alpha chain|nr:tryptophan synthase subunit alpha [Bifidobacteriaceae bacterium]
MTGANRAEGWTDAADGLAGGGRGTDAVGTASAGGGGAVSRTGAAIDAATADGRAALIAYLPVGFPDVAGSIDAVRALVDGGTDVIELGLPYSDPVMDGPVIEAAVTHALAAGTRVDDTFRAVEALAPLGVPVLVMSYYNPIFHTGVARCAARLADAGGAGLITPDLIPDEAEDWIAASDALGLDRVFLVAPTSTDARVRRVADASRGFVYVASTMGVTGERTTLSDAARTLSARTRAAGATRACVGVGVSTPAHAAEVASYADGVIVGSAFVRLLRDAATPAEAHRSLRALAATLRGAAHR